MRTSRQSNIELLRILAMLMVVNVHCFYTPFDLPLDYTGVKDWIRVSIDFLREASSISCVNLFVLISGYFSIRWNLRSISSLLFQVFFWIFLIYAIGTIVGFTAFSTKVYLKHIIEIWNGYWFIPCYLGLYLASPILNAFFNNHP